MTITIIMKAMRNFGASTFKIDAGVIYFKAEGLYIPVSPESIMEWATK